MISPRESPFAYEASGSAGGRILYRGECIAEIRDCTLYNMIFRPGDAPLIGDSIGVPLYWRQYADHQDPDRSAASRAQVTCVGSGTDSIRLKAESSTASRSMESFCLLAMSMDSRRRFHYVFDMRMAVPRGRVWTVTHNPQHGEAEFCNLWPVDVFVPDASRRKRYRACIVRSCSRTVRIPHHHLESRDKDRIVMRDGDEFHYVLEDRNLAMRLLSGRKIEAGVCAYMWDAHFGFRVCPDASPVDLPEGTEFNARWELYDLSRREAGESDAAARDRRSGNTAAIPLYVPGVNSFEVSIADVRPNHRHRAWPWTHEILEGDPADVRFGRTRRVGFEDRCSIFISHRSRAMSRWLATTLGPAFGEKEFADGGEYRLTAWIRARDVNGDVAIGLRYHRRGVGSVYDIGSYEMRESDRVTDTRGEWRKFEVRTGPISPAPDRMHLVLTLRGFGTTHFDNVQFERMSGR